MGVNSLFVTVSRQRRNCDLNPGPSAPESSRITTRLPSHPVQRHCLLQFMTAHSENGDSPASSQRCWVQEDGRARERGRCAGVPASSLRGCSGCERRMDALMRTDAKIARQPTTSIRLVLSPRRGGLRGCRGSRRQGTPGRTNAGHFPPRPFLVCTPRWRRGVVLYIE